MRKTIYSQEGTDGMERVLNITKKLKVILFMVVSLFVIGILGFMILEKTDFSSAITATIETLAFSKELGNGGIRVLELFLMLFGVIIIWWVLWWFFDLFIEGTFTSFISDIKFFNLIRKMEKHYIICGGGRVGEYVGEMMRERNVKYVIIEKDEEIAEDLKKRGHPVIFGDAMDEEVLVQNGIKKANALIAVLPETEKNIMITLTARELSPNIVIYSRAHKKNIAQRLKAAGANYVIVPEVAGAEKIVQQIFK